MMVMVSSFEPFVGGIIAHISYGDGIGTRRAARLLLLRKSERNTTHTRTRRLVNGKEPLRRTLNVRDVAIKQLTGLFAVANIQAECLLALEWEAV